METEQQYTCPHCGDEMYLSSGRWLCRNLRGCGFVEPAPDETVDSGSYLAVLRSRRRLSRVLAGGSSLHRSSF